MTPTNQKLAFKYAQSQSPKEACGLVVIIDAVEMFLPCRNISPYIDRFEIHPDDYAAAEELGEVVEVFHSHCYGKPYPSGVDKTICEEMKVKWSIVSVPNGEWYEFTPTGYRAPLIGREWAHGSLDCYSLLQDYYKEKLNIELPNFERQFEWWLKGEDLYAQNFVESGFRIVDFKDVKEHDILLFQVRAPVINHGGVYIGNRQFIHHLHRRLSSRAVFDGYWRKNCLKVVRHHSL